MLVLVENLTKFWLNLKTECLFGFCLQNFTTPSTCAILGQRKQDSQSFRITLASSMSVCYLFIINIIFIFIIYVKYYTSNYSPK